MSEARRHRGCGAGGTKDASEKLFPGQYFDAETNTNYNYFRTYDPSLGRYLQSDPIGLAGGVNTYTYTLNNPLIYADPSGLLVGDPASWGVTSTAAGAATGTSAAVAGAAVAASAGIGIGIGIGINKGVEHYTGQSIGSHIYDLLHPELQPQSSSKDYDPNRPDFFEEHGLPNPDDYFPDAGRPSPGDLGKSDRCYEKCKHLLGIDRLNQGSPYRKCYDKCMKKDEPKCE